MNLALSRAQYQSSLVCGLLALALFFTLAPTCLAQGTGATSPANSSTKPKLTITGIFDLYYLWQFSNPPSHLPQSSIGIPIYDSRVNTPSLSLAELNISQAAPSTGGFGFKATLQAGDTADIDHGGLGIDPATYPEARYKNIQQLYGTWLSPSGWGADLGEFYTPFGYEATESNANYNYSRSWIFTVLLPVYHTGLRIYTPNIHGFVGTFYLVRAINNTAHEGVNDDNHQPGYIGNFVYTDPKGKFTAAESLGYSEDMVAFSTQTDKTTLSDTDLTINLNAANLIGLNYTYRNDDFSSPNGFTNRSNGWAGYYRNQFTKRNAIALRYDGYQMSTIGVATVKPWEVTATLEDKPSGNFLTRLEYRHDGFNRPIFVNGNNPMLSKQQDTISLSEVYSFP